MVRDFPSLIDKAEPMWVKYKLAVQAGLLPPDVRKTLGQWFLDIIKVWEGIYPNWNRDLQPPESVSAYNERIKFANRVNAWASNVRGYRSTMGISGLGAGPLLIWLGILVAGAWTVSTFVTWINAWQNRNAYADALELYTEGKINSEQLTQAGQLYQNETGNDFSVGSMLGLGDLGSLAKYALIGAGVYLAWPLLSPLVRKLAGKLGGGRG